MENFETAKELEYIEQIRRFEPSDPAHADLFNAMLDALVNNDNFLKAATEKLTMGLGGFSAYPQLLTQAEYDALPEETKLEPGVVFLIRK